LTIPNVGEIWKYKTPRWDGGQDFVIITRTNHRKEKAHAINVEDATDLREILFENVAKYWIKVS
jgi:hypothetical protein